MDHVRTLLVAILVNVVHIKVLSDGAVQLNGDHGIFLAVYVLGLNVDLRAVKSGFSFRFHKRNAGFHQNMTNLILCALPVFIVTQIFLFIVRVPFGQTVSHIILHAENSEAVLRQFQAVLQLLIGLIRTDDQMSLGNGKLTHTGQSVHLAGILVTEQSGSLAHAVRQITVGLLRILIAVVLERAGHRTQCQHLLVLLLIAKNKHTLFIMIPVTGNPIEIALCHQWSLGADIAPLVILQVLNPSLQCLDDFCTLRQKQRETLSYHIHSGK